MSSGNLLLYDLLPLQAGEKAEPRRRIRHSSDSVYSPLIISKVVPILGDNVTMVGFLGISYLTFKAAQMIIEIRDNLIKQYNAWDFVNFLLFFPTISSDRLTDSVALKRRG